MTFSERPDRETDTAAGEQVLDETTVTVKRSPRIVNFIILGAVVGALVAVILTYAFPENPQFSRAQVLGFLLLACVAAGVAIACIVALVLGRIVARNGPTVVVDRVATRTADAGTSSGIAGQDAASGSLTSGATAAPSAPAPSAPSDSTSTGTPPFGGTPPGTTPPGASPSSTTTE